MVERIVLYTCEIKRSPFAGRVELALAEIGAQYELHEIPLSPAPAYYTKNINPVGKVPAITYGGPEVPPDQPSPESAKITESLVILEFLADIFPDSGLLPSDPIERAKVRFFVDAGAVKLLSPLTEFAFKGTTADGVITALEGVQSLLRPGAEVAVGEKFTIGDAALVPMLRFLELILDSHAGAYSTEERNRLKSLLEGDHFRVLREYYEKIKSRKSFKATCGDAEIIKQAYAKSLPKPQTS